MRSKTFESFTFAFLVVTSAGLPANEAAAYDPAPLCAYPETSPQDVMFTPVWAAPIEAPAMCAPRAPERILDAEIDDADARRALARARRLAARGRPEQAVLSLRVVERAFPQLADRLALEEADYRMSDGADELACRAYERAAESPQRDVAARAEVGRVRCLLSIHDRRAERELTDLRRRYPELPQDDELTFLLARSYEARGDREEAGRIYRQLDLTSPGTRYAHEARAEIERLRASGVDVRELTTTQEVERAERLTSAGYYEEARSEIARLEALPLPRTLAQQLARSAARIARVEGRWDDARSLLRVAAGLPSLDPEAAEAIAEQEEDLEDASAARDPGEIQRRIRAITHGRPLSRESMTRLFAVLRIAAQGGLRDVTNQALQQVAHRDRVPPGLRFQAAILGAGTGDDAIIAELLSGVRSHPVYGVAARYHYARALERMGRVDEARAEYVQVIASDNRRLPYYALWARTRMRATVHAPTPTPEPVAALAPALCADGPYTPIFREVAAKIDGPSRADDLRCTPSAPSPFALPSAQDAEADVPAFDPLAEADAQATEAELRDEGEERPSIELAPEQIAELLTPLAEEHGEAFPWLVRARDLVRLGELRAATDELYETYSAWRDALGSGGINAGYLAVLRGGAPPRHRVTTETWRERRRLPSQAQATLARVCAALGDHGLAIRFDGGFDVAGPRPRAYEQIVEAAAHRYGIEPELLFAVMRVESVYNPRIISYAGAIGLMQIMPRTGRLIAHRLGRDDFTVDQLLDPEVNIDFAAWYLSSLIERFDGRLPLAIASYNGGPHNVRRWMRDSADDMPLDAFLERIPFDQTHRYVRRVLTHYAAYRAQRGRPVTRLDVRLPRVEPDPLAF